MKAHANLLSQQIKRCFFKTDVVHECATHFENGRQDKQLVSCAASLNPGIFSSTFLEIYAVSRFRRYYNSMTGEDSLCACHILITVPKGMMPATLRTVRKRTIAVRKTRKAESIKKPGRKSGLSHTCYGISEAEREGFEPSGDWFRMTGNGLKSTKNGIFSPSCYT